MVGLVVEEGSGGEATISWLWREEVELLFDGEKSRGGGGLYIVTEAQCRGRTGGRACVVTRQLVGADLMSVETRRGRSPSERGSAAVRPRRVRERKPY